MSSNSWLKNIYRIEMYISIRLDTDRKKDPFESILNYSNDIYNTFTSLVFAYFAN